MSLPDVIWLEATNAAATRWIARTIAAAKETGHVNGQGSRVADVIRGGKPEILIAAGDGIYLIEIPAIPEDGKWRSVRLIPAASDEGFAVGDIDGDGDLDIAASAFQGNAPLRMLWWENPGDGSGAGRTHEIHRSVHDIDRIEIADLNGDGANDIVYSEERSPGPEPDARLVWLQSPSDPKQEDWRSHLLITQFSMNNLDVADIDGDGDMDVVTNEHKGNQLRLQIFENDGHGAFTERVIDRGKEMHLGARVADLDGDGDLDIFGHAWDNYRFLHLWRNDRIRK
jgi:hypothetical protein